MKAAQNSCSFQILCQNYFLSQKIAQKKKSLLQKQAFLKGLM